MFQETNNKVKIIKDILDHFQVDKLQLELNVPANELLNYLAQLFYNLVKEVAPEIYLMPFSGGVYLLQIIEKFNKKVIFPWLGNLNRKYKDLNSIKDLISSILTTYPKIDQIAKYFQLEHVLKFKEHTLPIIATQLNEIYEKIKFPVLQQFFLAEIDSSSLRDFFSILNIELAFQIFPLEEIEDKEEIVSIQVTDYESFDLAYPFQVDLDQFSNNLMNLTSQFKLKFPPDNRKKPGRSNVQRPVVYRTPPEIGIFQQYADLQSFKLLCNLSNQLFERTQFIAYIEQKQNDIQIQFNIEVFDKLMQFSMTPPGQQKLQIELLNQLIKTNFNMREMKENFYRLVFIEFQPIMDNFQKGWSRSYYLNTFVLPKKIKKNLPQNYLFIHQYPLFYWLESIKQMIQKLMSFINQKRKVNQIIMIQYFRKNNLTICYISLHFIRQQAQRFQLKAKIQ